MGLASAQAAVEAAVARALAGRVCTAAAVEIGNQREAVAVYAGRHGDRDGDRQVDERSLFDLASLTKVLATTHVVQQLVSAGRLGLEDRVARWAPEWSTVDRSAVTIEALLTHAAGLPAHVPFYRTLRGQVEIVQAICATPLAYDPLSRSVYSDLGFILLGVIIERVEGRSFDSTAHAALRDQLGLELTFLPSADESTRCVSTGFDEWRQRELRGEVHDGNAAALGGVAGHAGMFGTLAAVGRFARLVMEDLRAARVPTERRPLLTHRFAARVPVPGSSRALGWDTMLPTSSCGPTLSSSAIGHTGFTGTSMWLDWERGTYSVLLTNRVATGASAEAILTLRREVHGLSGMALDS